MHVQSDEMMTLDFREGGTVAGTSNEEKRGQNEIEDGVGLQEKNQPSQLGGWWKWCCQEKMVN